MCREEERSVHLVSTHAHHDSRPNLKRQSVGMEKQLLKNITDFFSKLYAVDSKWKEATKSAERHVVVLKNQIEQLRLLTR